MKRLFALLGNDISFSLSPVIHKAIYGALGIDADFELCDIGRDELAQKMPYLRERYSGFNVTKPFKTQIVEHLDCCNVRSCNVVSNYNSTLAGYSTDAAGFEADLAEIYDYDAKNMLVVGCGGAAYALFEWFSSGKARRVPKNVYVINRTKQRADEMCNIFPLVKHFCGEKIDIVVNCVSKDAVFVPDVFAEIAYDANYSPAFTEFMRQFKQRGARVYNGLGMLINQAVLSAQIMLDTRFSNAQRQQLCEHIKRVLNEKGVG